MEEKKKFYQKWWFWIITMIMALIIIVFISILALRNKLTPEETVSKFMYLIENKDYEEAKKLSSNDLCKLDILSNIEPSNLTFRFSEDKKSANAILLEEEIEVTNMNVILKNTLLGWKIESYEVTTELIEPQILEDRLKSNKELSDIQLLYWGESDVATKDEIVEYIKDNAMVAMIFSEMMKIKNYDKANEMYQPTVQKELNVEQLKEYDWTNYEFISNFEIINDFNCITVKLGDKNIWIYVAGKQIISIMESTT